MGVWRGGDGGEGGDVPVRTGPTAGQSSASAVGMGAGETARSRWRRAGAGGASTGLGAFGGAAGAALGPAPKEPAHHAQSLQAEAGPRRTAGEREAGKMSGCVNGTVESKEIFRCKVGAGTVRLL